jgi:hypothetical protein
VVEGTMIGYPVIVLQLRHAMPANASLRHYQTEHHQDPCHFSAVGEDKSIRKQIVAIKRALDPVFGFLALRTSALLGRTVQTLLDLGRHL